MISLDDLNRLSPDDVALSLEGVFEHSAWIALRAARSSPFGSRLQLLQQMRAVVDAATEAEQLALINAHPKLGARGRTSRLLTQESSREQKRAGLDACSDEEYALLERMNVAYDEKFGFPFILAVRGHDPPSIIAHMQQRLAHERAQEIRAALHEIGLIAGYRLADVVSSNAASETLAMLQQSPQAPSSSLVTEWMRAANLTVCRAESGQLIGVSSHATADSRMLIMGLHYDAASQSLVCDGRLGCAMGIAVSQQLREQSLELQFDLAVFSSLHDQTGIGDSRTGALNAPLDCISMQSVDADRGDSREILAALRSVGLSNCNFLITSRDSAAPVGYPPPSLLPRRIEYAVGALEQFLLHTQRTTDEKGPSLSHG